MPRKTTKTNEYEQILAMPGAVKAEDVQAADNTDSFELSPEEKEAILALREQRSTAASNNPQDMLEKLTKAFISAIESTRPQQKVKPYQRKKICKQCGREHKHNTPLTRTWFQHGSFELDPMNYCNETIELMNKVRPGTYANGLVIVTKRKDRAYDISWPVRTNAQRLRVMNEAGSTFEAILQRCIDEYNDPRRFRGPDDD